jgi:hypothetical protein
LFSVLEKRKILDNTVVLIIGDHPDSFFENGILGHGWSVDEYQRRTPLIVVNGRGTYDSPADQIDVPSILLHSVSSELTEPPAVFIPNNQRKVFLITGNVQNPREIAWKTMNDLATFDFITGLFQPGHKKPWYQPKDIPEVDQSSFTSLIHRWESFVLLRKEKVKENSIYP